MRHAKYKWFYINDSTHSVLCPNNMRSFKEFHDEIIKKKIKQKSLKDAIKIAEQKDNEIQRG